METLFIKILKKLIKEQLNPLSASEQSKSQSLIHNNVLSLGQQTIIDNLSDDIVRYSGGESDEESKEYIITLINAARIKVQPQREGHQQPKDEGETIKCLTQLALHADDLYKKISSLKQIDAESYAFTLLNVPAKYNPLHLIYEMVIYYIGDEIFNPNKKIDVKTRAQKELHLGKRVSSLSERIQPHHNLNEQKSRALEMLDDLKGDNDTITRGETSMISTALSKLSIWGVSLNVCPTGEGRLGRLIARVKLTIKGMITKEFEPLEQNIIVVKPSPEIKIVKLKEEEHHDDTYDDDENAAQKHQVSTSL